MGSRGLASWSVARASGSKATATATEGLESGPVHSWTSLRSRVVRRPQPRKRMSQADPDGPRPRPAPSLGALRPRSWLDSAALPAKAEVVTAAPESRHCAPGKGSPSVLWGAGSRGPGPSNCPGLRLSDLTAFGACPVSMVTGFSWRGPRPWGCPVAPARCDSLCRSSRRAGACGTARL